MTITYEPSKLLARIAPKGKIEKLMTERLTVNRATLRTLTNSEILSRTTLSEVALKVLKKYKSKYKEERESGESVSQSKDEAIHDKKLMVQRVQNLATYEVSRKIEDRYSGEYYEWLPSDAITPDPLHQLNYGKVFQVGVGEMPGERYGCRCGMRILVDETRLML